MWLGRSSQLSTVLCSAAAAAAAASSCFLSGYLTGPDKAAGPAPVSSRGLLTTGPGAHFTVVRLTTTEKVYSTGSIEKKKKKIEGPLGKLWMLMNQGSNHGNCLFKKIKNIIKNKSNNRGKLLYFYIITYKYWNMFRVHINE